MLQWDSASTREHSTQKCCLFEMYPDAFSSYVINLNKFNVIYWSNFTRPVIIFLKDVTSHSSFKLFIHPGDSERAVVQIEKRVCKQYKSDVVLVLRSALWSLSTECVGSCTQHINIFLYRPPVTERPCWGCCSAFCELGEVHHQHYYLVSCCWAYGWIILRMDIFFFFSNSFLY